MSCSINFVFIITLLQTSLHLFNHPLLQLQSGSNRKTLATYQKVIKVFNFHIVALKKGNPNKFCQNWYTCKFSHQNHNGNNCIYRMLVVFIKFQKMKPEVIAQICSAGRNPESRHVEKMLQSEFQQRTDAVQAQVQIQ